MNPPDIRPPLYRDQPLNISFLFLDLDISTAWDDQRSEKRVFDRSKLPTAPRSVRETDIDLSRLPKGPPYTLFLGNLSYEVSEDSLKKFFESRKVQVS